MGVGIRLGIETESFDATYTPSFFQSAFRDVQTLVKHATGLYDLRTFNDTKNSLQLHMGDFMQCVMRPPRTSLSQ